MTASYCLYALYDLHYILVGVVEVERICISWDIHHLEDYIQACLEGLPGVAAQGGVVIRTIEFLDEFEAIVDEFEVGGEGLAVVDLLFHAAAHVVVLEGQAVGALPSFDHCRLWMMVRVIGAKE